MPSGVSANARLCLPTTVWAIPYRRGDSENTKEQTVQRTIHRQTLLVDVSLRWGCPSLTPGPGSDGQISVGGVLLFSGCVLRLIRNTRILGQISSRPTRCISTFPHLPTGENTPLCTPVSTWTVSEIAHDSEEHEGLAETGVHTSMSSPWNSCAGCVYVADSRNSGLEAHVLRQRGREGSQLLPRVHGLLGR